MYKITKEYPEYVFTRLGQGLEVNAVDHKRKMYIILADQTVSKVQGLLDRATTDNSVEFFRVEIVEGGDGE